MVILQFLTDEVQVYLVSFLTRPLTPKDQHEVSKKISKKSANMRYERKLKVKPQQNKLIIL